MDPEDQYNSSLRYGIGEYALQNVIAEIARNKSHNIVSCFPSLLDKFSSIIACQTVILDCCYSRGGGDAVQNEVRSIPPKFRCTMQTESGHNNGDRRGSIVRKEFLPHPTQKDSAHCVTLAACSPTEEAREQPFRGLNGVRGVFTATLISTLREASMKGLDNLTYSELVTRMWQHSADFGEFLPLREQRPRCEGPEEHKCRAVFSTRVVLGPGSPPVNC